MSGRAGVRRAGVLGATVAVLVLAVACETPHDLGTFGGEQSNAIAINDAGVAVGWADTIAGGPRAFTVPAGGTLAGVTSLQPDGANSNATAINGKGDVAYIRGLAGAVRYHDTTDVTLPMPTNPGYTIGVEPAGINDAGIVVGSLSLMYGEARSPFAWSPTRQGLIALPEPNGASYQGQAFAINGRGQIVGQTLIAGSVVPVVWNPDGNGGWRQPEVLPMVSIATHGQARAINDRGDIAGSAYAADYTSRAVVWRWTGDRYEVAEVPTPAGNAYGNGINDRGVVVGSMSSTGNIWDPRPAAFAWKAGDAKATELLGLGGDASAANAINDRGVIVGWAKRKGQTGLRAVRWVDEEPAAAR